MPRLGAVEVVAQQPELSARAHAGEREQEADTDRKGVRS